MGTDYSNCLGYERNKQSKYGLAFPPVPAQMPQNMEMFQQQGISVV